MTKVTSINFFKMAHELTSNTASSALPALAFTLVDAGTLASFCVR
jgi:hypothetical protein